MVFAPVLFLREREIQSVDPREGSKRQEREREERLRGDVERRKWREMKQSRPEGWKGKRERDGLPESEDQPVGKRGGVSEIGDQPPGKEAAKNLPFHPILLPQVPWLIPQWLWPWCGWRAQLKE